MAIRLTNLLCNLDHGAVALFDGRWGIGKSTFIRRWLSHLRAEGIPSIYLDAFAVDYLESPFVAVAGAFSSEAERANQSDHPTYRAFIDAAAKVGKAVGSTAAKIGVKALTLGVIGTAEIEAIGEVKEVVADALADRAEEAVKELISEHSRRESELAALREKLARFPALLSTPQDADQPPRPLVVVIDELDRCRPDFALGMVETIKHFFGVDNIHFVLVTNREHLLLSVTHKYGSFETADEYLRKFYDFQVMYEHDYSERGGRRIKQRVQELTISLLPPTNERNDVQSYIEYAAVAHRLTLRDIENVFLNLALAYAAVQPREFKPTILVSFLCLLKTIDPRLYSQAKQGTLTYDNLRVRLFSQANWGDLNVERVSQVFQYHLDPDLDLKSDDFSGFGDHGRFNLGRFKVIPYICNSIIDRFAPSQGFQQQ